MRPLFQLEERLRLCAGFVPENARLADIGTDHAYLPVWLCRSGKIQKAIAADIGEGPLQSARDTIARYQVAGQVETRLSDGLARFAAGDVDTSVIAGMGGELIVSILERAAFVRSPDVRLILQPMTHPEILRKWLLDNGFSILGELLSAEEHRIYQTVCAAYAPDACAAPYDDAELLTGRAYPPEQADLHRALICKTRHTLTARRDARAGSGHTTADEDTLLTALAAQEARIARQIR